MRWVRWLMLMMMVASVWMWQQWPNEKLRIVFCDVGQGDASLVIKGDFQMLIDTGPSKPKLMDCLATKIPFWDKEIEVVVNSHDQRDHWGVIGAVKDSYQIGQEITASTSVVGDVLRYGSLTFEIVSTGFGEQNDENETSLVGMLTDGGVRVLYTGDIGEKTESALIESGLLRKLTVLKVAHHGSKFSSSKSFLDEVRPDLAVISVGEKNSYGHPSGEVLIRLEMVGAKILRTDQGGTIEMSCEKDECKVESEK